MDQIKKCTDVMSNYSEYNDKLQGNNIQLEMSLICRPQVRHPAIDWMFHLPLALTHLLYETNKVMYQCCE